METVSKSIRYSQSSISPVLNYEVKPKIKVTSPFREDVYLSDPIRIVRYSSAFTTYDNRQRYWARDQDNLTCIVYDANDPCNEDNSMVAIAWSTKNMDDDTPEVHEAIVRALDYQPWIMFRCAQQGASFSLDGKTNEPLVEVEKPTTKYRKNKVGIPLPAKRTELDVSLFSIHLQQAVSEGIQLFIGNTGTPVVFYNDSLPIYLTRDGIESRLRVLSYDTYTSMEIKAMAENQDEWDTGDWDAYEKEYDRLLAQCEIEEEDEDTDALQPEVDDLNRGVGVLPKDYGTDYISRFCDHNDHSEQRDRS